MSARNLAVFVLFLRAAFGAQLALADTHSDPLQYARQGFGPGYFTDADQLEAPLLKPNEILHAPVARAYNSPDAPPVLPPKIKDPGGKYEFVDLHSHAFMSQGMGLMFNGDFNDPLQARDWSDRFSTKVNPGSLRASNLGVMVVSFYALPFFAPDRRGAIRAEIKQARDFVKSHPDWVIATTPEQATAAHDAGKHVMIFSLEGASGIIDNEKDIKEFVDQDGIRIVTFAHLAGDHLTGAAFMNGYNRLATPIKGFEAVFAPHHDCYGTTVNPDGLTEDGRNLARELIKHHVWIDLSHSPEAAERELVPMLRAAGQPLLYTHGGLRGEHGAERSMSPAQLAAVKDSGGLIGLGPIWDSLKHQKIDPKFCLKQCEGKCSGGVYALATEFDEAAKAVGPAHVMLGSDFNGAENHLPPSLDCPTGTSMDRKAGFYNPGQFPELWSALRKTGAPVQDTAYNGVENFISIWSKVYRN